MNKATALHFFTSSFKAAKGLSNPHTQTLLPRLIRSTPEFSPYWQDLQLPDQDFLELAWSVDPDLHSSSQKPLFILFHGLEGGFKSPYGHGLLKAFSDRGWLAVLMHFRGCGRKPNRLARAYHSGEIEDARFFLKDIEARYPGRLKIAVGVSLGGNMLARYLAHYRQDPLLDAATLISAPLDLIDSAKRIEKGFSRVYRWYLLGSLKKKVMDKKELMNQTLGLTEKKIRNIKSLYEFDDLVTAPLHGFNDAIDYYTRCSAMSVMNDILIPTQVIQAKDDPFMTDAVIPAFQLNENIDYKLSTNGGHVGFISGSPFYPKSWLEEYLPNYYNDLLGYKEVSS